MEIIELWCVKLIYAVFLLIHNVAKPPVKNTDLKNRMRIDSVIRGSPEVGDREIKEIHAAASGAVSRIKV